MKICDLLKPQGVGIGADAASQDDVIGQLIDLMGAYGSVRSKELCQEAIVAREAEYPCAVGGGIAITHAATDAVKRPGIAAITLSSGVDWHAFDDKDVDLVFMVTAPASQRQDLVAILAKLSSLLMHPEFADALRASADAEAFCRMMGNADEVGSLDAATMAVQMSKAPGAVPGGAPAEGGITASSIGWHVRAGIERMLPFLMAAGVLGALSCLVEMCMAGTISLGATTPFSAFFEFLGRDGMDIMLPVLAGYIASSIADRPGLAPGIVGGLMVTSGLDDSGLAIDPELALHASVSGGFLAALLAGLVAGILTLFVKRACDRLPSTLEGIKPILIYPVGAILATGAAMSLLSLVLGAVYNWTSGFLSGLGGTNLLMLCILVATLMSVDMGGVLSKASYLFVASLLVGTESVQTAQHLMAACMAGAMIAPLAIAMSATVIARGKWRAADKPAHLACCALGLFGFTEGAIPFAAMSPATVIPACMAGSALAGGLSAAFDCATTFPRGGILALPAMENPGMWLLAILAGSVFSALMLSFLKEPSEA